MNRTGKNLLRVTAMILLTGFVTGATWAKPVETTGTIESVTVYRGQALVTRLIELEAPRGPVELVVTDLPARIVADSLYASGEKGVQVRAVRYRTRAVRAEPREEVRRIDEEIEKVNELLRKIQSSSELLKQKEGYLANLERFTAAKVNDEMAKGTLDPETITSVTLFVFKQRGELATEKLKLSEEERQAKEKLGLLQRKRNELTARSTRTAREAVVFLDKPGRGKSVVHLNYLVGGAGWSPTYNIRANGPDEQVSLEYNALVQQRSEEDWNGVKLTLSTASPAMVAEAPILTPFWVTLSGAPMQTARFGAADVVRGQRAAASNLAKALHARRNVDMAEAAFAQDWNANAWANRLQIIDLVGGKDVLLAGPRLASGDDVLSVNYALPGDISIPSRSDQQMIQIASLRLKGEFYYLAAPVLGPYIYQQAEVVNTSDIALLSGAVNSYMGGQFMGSGRVPMVAKGQRFTVGFGVDSQLRATRELADKTDRIRGGNRELTFKYRLLIDNYKDKPVKVRLMDRLPDPKGADVRVTLVKTSDELSKDPVYLRSLRKSGILRWEIDVPARASGETARTVEYEYKLEFDRKMHLGEPEPARLEKEKLEFQKKLQLMQMRK